MTISNTLSIEYLDPGSLKDYKRQLRKPSKNQVQKTIRFIQASGGVQIPIVIDEKNTIVVGHHWAVAAREAGLTSVPVTRLSGLDEQRLAVLRIAYDRLGEEATWDRQNLAAEFEELMVLVPDLTITGFDQEEIDITFDVVSDILPEDQQPAVEAKAVSRLDDVFALGDSRLLCGDALIMENYTRLIDQKRPTLVFTDAPYNVEIEGHAGNSGAIKHREFVMASGELTEKEFSDFLHRSHKNMVEQLIDGGIIFSCMDWRHIRLLLSVGDGLGLELKNLCVWDKGIGGMGSLYRSQHELVTVFKKPGGKHTNNVQLGANGRNRTNVWSYAGVNSFAGRSDDLKMHPTVKPMEMVADAIKDCSKRSDFVLDVFGGAGTTLIAAQHTGRNAYLMELDPLYCDVTVRRWQNLTGNSAVHLATGKTFRELEQER